VTTRTTETHRLDTEPGYWCWTCHAPTVTRSVVAIVDSASLRVLDRHTSATCSHCGHLD
jgi:hypothetical protein